MGWIRSHACLGSCDVTPEVTPKVTNAATRGDMITQTLQQTGERLRRVDAVVLGTLALALRVPAFVADRHFHPDDGTYGMSAVAMRAGAKPFDTVFSSQGPMHLVGVYVGDLLTGRQMNSPRAIAVLCGVVATIAAAAAGTRLGARRGGLIAGGIVATTGSMLWTSGPLTADAPTVALVALGLVAALRYSERPSGRRAAWVGAAIGVGLMCKVAVAILGFAPAIVLLVRPRIGKHLATAAGTSAVIGAMFVFPFGATDVWDQAIRYQLHTERERSMAANAAKVVTTLWSRDLVLVALLLAAVAIVIARRPAARATLAAGCWVAAMLVFLIVQPALWRNHMSHLVVPVSVFAAVVLGPLKVSHRGRRIAALILVLLAGTQIRFLRTILDPPPYDRTSQAAIDALGELPRDARVVSDEIGLVWRADRRTPDDLVDFSIKQIQQERITMDRLRSVTARPGVCAVLVWSARHLGSFGDLAATLQAQGYEERQRFAGQNNKRVLYVRAECPGPG